MTLLKNRYSLSSLCIYTVAVLYLHFAFQQRLSEMLIPFAVVGLGFSFIAWQLTKKLPAPLHQLNFKKEFLVLIVLTAWIVFYITYGGVLINKILPAYWIENPAIYSGIIFLRKLIFFVLIPFAVYKLAGFTGEDFGLNRNAVRFFSKESIVVFLLLSIAALIFQYFFSIGAKPFRNGEFNTRQLFIGLPLCFIYLLFDVGLIEEFFFRGLLQSRLSVLLKSSTGGIIVSAVIFGLVHAPGLYLRGAESEGVSEQLPFIFWAVYTVCYMSVAGIFLGIIFSKTKNLWLVMAIYAMVDLLPNFKEFLTTWGI
jgi:uncharacterized protein